MKEIERVPVRHAGEGDFFEKADMVIYDGVTGLNEPVFFSFFEINTDIKNMMSQMNQGFICTAIHYSLEEAEAYCKRVADTINNRESALDKEEDNGNC